MKHNVRGDSLKRPHLDDYLTYEPHLNGPIITNDYWTSYETSSKLETIFDALRLFENDERLRFHRCYLLRHFWAKYIYENSLKICWSFELLGRSVWSIGSVNLLRILKITIKDYNLILANLENLKRIHQLRSSMKFLTIIKRLNPWNTQTKNKKSTTSRQNQHQDMKILMWFYAKWTANVKFVRLNFLRMLWRLGKFS